ncbi:MAG TPA: CehA/McbA family metallohydrolase [Steroidobacter sp.]|uniref:CehA/McbA family metallohydrolase n=1 Tax=Steroidobacter sp. TaxID=1978227 RepID=UPI002ED8152B
MRLLVLLVWCGILINVPVNAHVVNADTTQPLDWHSPQIDRVVSIGYPQGMTEEIEGKHCMSGSMLNIDVLDDYAYDIDESVLVEVEFDLERSSTGVEVLYDRSVDSPGMQRIELPVGDERWYRKTFTLDRARFAGGPMGTVALHYTDFSIGAIPRGRDGVSKVTVCSIELKRSYETIQPQAYGSLLLRVLDEDNRPTPARVGIYDATGRMPLPTEQAVTLKFGSKLSRTIALRQGSVSWPAKNLQVFYIDGSYRAKLPIGVYNIIAARGLEYRISSRSIVIEANKDTTVAMNLQRWANMTAKGWYSGDTHMHYPRNDTRDDVNVRLLMQGEDLHVANLLQAGSSGAVYGKQDRWGEQRRYGDWPYTLVSGQEDPRTLHLGHTVGLDLKEPVHSDPEHYYLYDRTFENVRRQGGVIGYAHAAGSRMHAPKGLSLDVPYGLVDLVEVLQAGTLGTERWFDFLNLGYKLTPSAGSDAPYFDHYPGSVRNYVYVGGNSSVHRWFEGLKAGRTFVTNGPMLQFTVNGKPMGAEVKVNAGDVLSIDAVATINPDVDRIHKLELIEQGRVVEQTVSEEGAERLQLSHDMKAVQGTWFVLKAAGGRGRSQLKGDAFGGADVSAVSAPIYISVASGGSFCKLAAVPEIVADMKQQLRAIVEADVVNGFELEPWDTREPRKKYWTSQRALLQERINGATKAYDAILSDAKHRRCRLHGME